ncbi:hypothetical protein [Parabacteroides sp. PF5-6]|uniref:hypothetical protein n=1 Tax=Parabacteroides sp. PF5-6 TaxID=1742403 RepID=UPI002404DA24|nr:hypothetical protein [Parabacteroides sp. PF5-6]MDF9831786.1 hypothetical protein [Parabacteroides sp. PF5-6]
MEIIFIFLITIVFTFVTASMARKKGRSGLGWFLVACFITPYLSMIILACLGDTEKRRRERMLEDERIRQSVTNKPE